MQRAEAEAQKAAEAAVRQRKEEELAAERERARQVCLHGSLPFSLDLCAAQSRMSIDTASQVFQVTRMHSAMRYMQWCKQSVRPACFICCCTLL